MNIILGYDGSNSAKVALKVAKMHAKAFNAKVFVLFSLLGGHDEKLGDIERAEQDLKYAKDYFDEAGIECEVQQLVKGLAPGEDLVEYANQNNADEIIIGIRKKSKVGKLVFGSTAQYVILQANCPVVSAK